MDTNKEKQPATNDAYNQKKQVVQKIENNTEWIDRFVKSIYSAIHDTLSK